jgi:outer membrane protein OmpA-like peptidoglycan-associated protein
MALPGYRTGATVLLTLALFSSARTAHAQGFALDRFDPSERGSEWFANESLDFRSQNKFRPAAGIVFEGQYRPLAIYNTDGSVNTEVVRHVVTIHPGASIVLWERARFGVSIPVALYQDGTDGTLNGITYGKPRNSPSLGDLRLTLDGRIYGKYDGPLRVAAGVRLYAPTGNRGDYQSDENVRFEPRLMAAGDVKGKSASVGFVYSATIGLMYRDDSQPPFAGSKLGTEMHFAASAGIKAADNRLVIGPEIFGSTVVTEGSEAFSKRSTPLEIMLGAHYTVPTKAGDIRFGAGAGTGLTRGFGAPLVRYMAMLEWMMREKIDRDGDGIFDDDDACPDEPGIPELQGCPRRELPPPPPKPVVVPPPSDRDGDGIIDTEDACPDKPGVKDPDPKKNGCPPDKDGDGIPDADDACPDKPGVPSADKRFNGCPPDIDGDGILNEQDACFDVPGKPDPDPKKNGCPTAAIVGGVIKVTDQVKFKTASSEILPGKDSEDVLQAVLKILKDHAEIKKLRIEGHTDNKGTAEYNKTLSGARAASVVNWLVGHGIAKDRLTSQGFGMDNPIDTNDTEEGRRNNRRVEFHIVEDQK